MFEKITLSNGIRIVTEHLPYLHSAAIGIWVGAGSRNEQASENGAAHFIEHMLFKGTDGHSAASLVSAMDEIGGQINAVTSRENTCFYARVLDTHLDTASELLAEMFFRSRFAPEDIESEKKVILEEIHMYDDTPDDMVVERMLRRCFPGALGRPVCGTAASLRGLDSTVLRRFMATQYSPDRVVIAVSGSFTDANIRRVEALFSGMTGSAARRPRCCVYAPAFTVRRKATEQNQLCLGFPGLSTTDPRRYIVSLMSQILGGGMSSRLFQSVREERALCYSIYTFSTPFAETGLFGISAGFGRDTEQQALVLIRQELERFLQDGVTPEELNRAREQTKSELVMDLESNVSHMSMLGHWELAMGHCPSPEDRLAAYDAVTREDILSAAREILDFERLSFSAVGRVDAAEAYAEILR